MRFALFTIALTLLSLSTCAVTVSGIAYDWLTIEPLPNVIIKVFANESLVLQRVSGSAGEYSFNLSAGTYVIEAIYLQNGTVYYYSKENFSPGLSQQNVFFDLILFPPTEDLFPDFEEEIPELEEDIIDPALFPQEDNTLLYLLIVLAVLSVSALAYAVWKRPEPRSQIVSDTKVISDELYDVVELIKGKGGRIAQRELRRELNYSAAKMSQTINELETKDIIKRIKKGRGNIISLK